MKNPSVQSHSAAIACGIHHSSTVAVTYPNHPDTVGKARGPPHGGEDLAFGLPAYHDFTQLSRSEI